jgi:hypothetical protein
MIWVGATLAVAPPGIAPLRVPSMGGGKPRPYHGNSQ